MSFSYPFGCFRGISKLRWLIYFHLIPSNRVNRKFHSLNKSTEASWNICFERVGEKWASEWQIFDKKAHLKKLVIFNLLQLLNQYFIIEFYYISINLLRFYWTYINRIIHDLNLDLTKESWSRV